jgi:hypothetical protein
MMTSLAFLFCGFLKSAERPVPHLVEVGAQARNALRIELIKSSGSLLGVSHKTRILQHLEVLRYGRTSHGQRARELVDGDRAHGELLKDGHARGIGEGIQSGL